MRKRLATLGMAGLMAAMSVVPAFAAPTDGVENREDGTAYQAFEDLKDNETSEKGVDYWKTIDSADESSGLGFGTDETPFETTLDKNTEVGVQQGMSYMVTIPSFISLAGDKTAADHEAAFYVAVIGDIAGNSEITVKPNLTNAIKRAPENERANYSDFYATTGTFPLQEDGKMKKDLVATIELKDVDWTIDTDGTQNDTELGDVEQRLGVAMNKVKGYTTDTKFADLETTVGAHAGIVSVEKLSAGKFRNTINFDVTYTKDTTTTPEVTEP